MTIEWNGIIFQDDEYMYVEMPDGEIELCFNRKGFHKAALHAPDVRMRRAALDYIASLPPGEGL